MKINNVSLSSNLLKQSNQKISVKSKPQSQPINTNERQNVPKKKKKKILGKILGLAFLVLLGVLIKGTRNASKIHKEFNDIYFDANL